MKGRWQMSKIRLVGAAFSIAMAAWSVDARAYTELQDPYGDAASEAHIGSDAWGQWIGWQNMSTSDCSWTQIGDTTGLFDDYLVSGLGGDDHIRVRSTTLSFCGYPLATPSYNGHYLDLSGGAGNDTLWSVTTLDTWIFGGDGNESINSGRGSAGLFSQNGDDTIWATGSGSGAQEDGGNGNDCLFIVSTQTPSNMSCGDGSDLWSGPGSRPADCETTDTHCCGIC
jgi:Ca2+-binding RTX toxin-like protein